MLADLAKYLHNFRLQHSSNETAGCVDKSLAELHFGILVHGVRG